MPDIGLLQGPPRPRLTVVPPASPGPDEPSRNLAREPVVEMAAVERTAAAPLLPPASDAPRFKVAAHAAVVRTEEPFAVLEAPLEDATAPALAAEPEPEPVSAPVPAAATVATIAPLEPVAEPASVIELAKPLHTPVVAVADIVAMPAAAAVTAVAAAEASEPPSTVPVAGSSQSGSSTPPFQTRRSYLGPPIRLSDLLWLLLGLVLIIATGLGIRDPWPADEPRFASLARDMVQSGEWLFPRVGGDLYQDKPPLFFWMLAICYTFFGSFKAWFLIPALLAAGGVLFLIYDFGRRTVSREAGLGAALLVLCSLQFVIAFRGAQIDPVLCLLTTLSVYAFLRHLLLGDGWRWYFLGGFCAGLGVITKGVGFLPVLLLIPFFSLRGFGWQGLATVDAGRAGWRWWLAPLAMLLAISLWFVPMLMAVSASGSPDYIAYRDEILFKQTVGRYAAAWHHVKGWYYFIAEVIPSLWLPWSLLLFWLVPRFKAAFRERDARVWLPLFWVMLVVLFFSMSPGKRGIYIMPALPALALASLPLLSAVLERRGVRIAGWVLALGFWIAGCAAFIAVKFNLLGVATQAELGTLPVQDMLLAFIVLCGLGLIGARLRAPLAAWPATLAALCVSFSYFLAPLMNGERSGSDFIRETLRKVRPEEQLALVAYKEQFLLYLDRPTVNFGHRRWQEGPQEYFDAAAWLNAGANRVLLVPEEALVPKDRFRPSQPAIPCFKASVVEAGISSGGRWFLVRAPAETACAALGNAARAIAYH